MRRVGQERRSEPDPLVQGPGRVGGARQAQEPGYRTTSACPSTGNLANAVVAHAAAAGMESYVFIPADLEEQKILATGVYGTNLVKVRGNYDDVNRLCTELSADRDWAFVNVNVRPYYAEGSKTLAYEIAEGLGFELPDRVVAPVASGSLFTKIARGFDEWREVGLVAGDADDERRPGRGPLAGRPGVRRGLEICKPVKPDTGRGSRWRSATRPTGRTRSSWPAAAAARSTPSPTTRSGPAPACWRRRPASSPRPPAGSPRRRWPSSPRVATSIPTSAWWRSSPGRA